MKLDKNKKKAMIVSAGVLLFGSNLYLTFNENSKVHRTSYITEWTIAQKENIKDHLSTSGVVTPLEEHHIYYNATTGEFKNFLVAKGDKVRNGTPLFEFSSDTINKDKQKLEIEQGQLAREVALIDEQIQQLTYLQSISESTTTTTTPPPAEGENGEGGEVAVPVNSSGDIVKYSIEKEIYDKQLEKSRLLGEIQKYDQVIKSFSDRDQLGINSRVTGTVKNINFDLTNPIMTIISDTPKIEGTFTEEELKNVETGMKVKITSELSEEKIAGTLTKIAAYPENTPSVKKKSSFPFEIELEEENEDIIQGTHVKVSITTNEIKDAVTIPKKTIFDQSKKEYVYILNDAGKVEKREITRGIDLASKVQVEDGIQEENLLLPEGQDVKQAGGTFITPLNSNKLEKRWFEAERKSSILKWIAAGFLRR